MNMHLIEATEENAVKNLQRYIKQLSFFYPLLIKDIIITGVYDNNTRDAVTNLQKAFGIRATGMVDKITWDTVFEKYIQSLNENSSVGGILPFYDKPSSFEITLGDRSQIVKLIEIILDEISSVYEFEKEISQNGIYDKDKADAVKIFQSVNLLPVTGNVDRITWNTLAGEYNAILRSNLSE
jgi:peptidoglycan hydrolase-like protein with peptidoglycan-binding domain